MDQRSSKSAGLRVTSEVDWSGKVLAEKYRVLRAVARTAGGTTYVCQHETLDQQVALKVLHAERSADPDFVARFQREAQAAKRLDHVNAVRLLDFGKTEAGELYLALQHVEGRDLGRVLFEDGPLSDERIVGIMSQVLSALSAAHALGLVHRDLKPENILLREVDADTSAAVDDHVTVGDFGTAQPAPAWLPAAPGHVMSRSERRSKPDVITRTAAYMSPEQAHGERPDARSDLYSAGVLLFQLLTRTQPFMAETQKQVAVMHCVTPPPPPSSYGPVNPNLETICLKALSKTREARFQSAQQMQAALHAAVAHSGSGAAPRRSWLPPVSLPQLRASATESSTPSLAPAERVVLQPTAASRRSITLLVGGIAACAVALASLPHVQPRHSAPQSTRARAAVRQQPAALAATAQPKLKAPSVRPVTSAPRDAQLTDPTTLIAELAPVSMRALAAPNRPSRRARRVPATVLTSAVRAMHPEQAYASDAPLVPVAEQASSELDPTTKPAEQPAADGVAVKSQPSAEERTVIDHVQPPAASPIASIATPTATLSTPRPSTTPAPTTPVSVRARSTAHASVSLGAIVTHAAVSKASVRSALNQAELNHCYRTALDRGEAADRPIHASLEFTTNMSGRIVSAKLEAGALADTLRKCVEQVVRAGRVREVDTGAAKASIELTFQLR